MADPFDAGADDEILSTLRGARSTRTSAPAAGDIGDEILHVLRGRSGAGSGEPGLLSRAGSTAMSVLGAPKRAVDIAANYYAGLPEALNPALEPIPTGELVKEAVFPEEEARDSYARSIGREALGFATDLASDPLSYAAVGALGKVP